MESKRVTRSMLGKLKFTEFQFMRDKITYKTYKTMRV